MTQVMQITLAMMLWVLAAHAGLMLYPVLVSDLL